MFVPGSARASRAVSGASPDTIILSAAEASFSTPPGRGFHPSFVIPSGVETSLAVAESLLRRFGHCSQPDPGEVFIRLQQIRPRALDDLQQIIHRRNFFELLGQEPLEKIDRDVIVLLSRQPDQPVDLLRDMNFLVERKLHRIACRLEFRFRRINRRDHHPSAGIDHVFDEPQRVSFLFLGLLEKMLRQLRQRLGGEMRRNRVILQLRTEFVAYLLIDRIDDFLTRKHRETYRGLRGCKAIRSASLDSEFLFACAF